MSLEETKKERKKCGGGGGSRFVFSILWETTPWVVFHPLGAYGEFPGWLSRLDPAPELLRHAKVGNRSGSVALVC